MLIQLVPVAVDESICPAVPAELLVSNNLPCNSSVWLTTTTVLPVVGSSNFNASIPPTLNPNSSAAGL